MIHFLIRITQVFLPLLVVFYGLIYFFQERLLFYPEKLDPDFTFIFPEKFLESNIKTASGQNINYLVFNADSTKGVILYFHGNAGSLKDWGYAGLEIAQNTGWSVWIMDYPGFGKSSGPLPKSETILLEMSRTLWSEIQIQKPELPVVLFGRSIGTGIATSLAVEKNPEALILETPYLSIAKLGHEIFPIIPELISRFDFDNEKLIPSTYKMPLLIFHGTQDDLIPHEHGKYLSQLKANIQFVSIAGGGHNNLSDFPQYWPSLTAFLDRL